MLVEIIELLILGLLGCLAGDRLPRGLALHGPSSGPHICERSVSRVFGLSKPVDSSAEVINGCVCFRNSARFLWKSIPQGFKESKPELVAAWRIGQCLWTCDYSGVYDAIRGFEWSPEVAGLVTAFSGWSFAILPL